MGTDKEPKEVGKASKKDDAFQGLEFIQDATVSVSTYNLSNLSSDFMDTEAVMNSKPTPEIDAQQNTSQFYYYPTHREKDAVISKENKAGTFRRIFKFNKHSQNNSSTIEKKRKTSPASNKNDQPRIASVEQIKTRIHELYTVIAQKYRLEREKNCYFLTINDKKVTLEQIILTFKSIIFKMVKDYKYVIGFPKGTAGSLEDTLWKELRKLEKEKGKLKPKDVCIKANRVLTWHDGDLASRDVGHILEDLSGIWITYDDYQENKSTEWSHQVMNAMRPDVKGIINEIKVSSISENEKTDLMNDLAGFFVRKSRTERNRIVNKLLQRDHKTDKQFFDEGMDIVEQEYKAKGIKLTHEETTGLAMSNFVKAAYDIQEPEDNDEKLRLSRSVSLMKELEETFDKSTIETNELIRKLLWLNGHEETNKSDQQVFDGALDAVYKEYEATGIKLTDQEATNVTMSRFLKAGYTILKPNDNNVKTIAESSRNKVEDKQKTEQKGNEALEKPRKVRPGFYG